MSERASSAATPTEFEGTPGSGSAPATPSLSLTAYRLHPMPMPIEPGPLTRDWMDRTPQRYAYRCLPMVIANQAGWLILSGHAISVTWNGGNGVDALKVECTKGPAPCPALSNFGCGI